MRKKRSAKKWIIGLSITVVVLAAAAFAAVTIINIQNDKKTVEVMPVSYLTTYYYGDEAFSYGTISSDNMQSLYPDGQRTISEIFVEEGQSVSIGDPLLQYDKEKLELDLERLDLEQKTADNNITVAKRQLQRLKNTKAYVPPTDAPLPTLGPLPTEEPLPTEPPTPTPAPTKTPFPPSTATLYSVIPANAQAYAGTGTTDDPYLFLCAQDCTISPDFIAQLLGQTPYGTDVDHPSNTKTQPFAAVFEVREEDSIYGDLLQSFTLDGTKLSPIPSPSTAEQAQGTSSHITLQSLSLESGSPSIQKLTESTNSNNYNDQQYTAEQLKTLIAEKEKEITDLQLGLERIKINYTRADLALKNSKVLSTVNGVVKSLISEKDASVNGTAFLVVSGENTYYLNGSVNESMLDAVHVGDSVTGLDFMTGNSYDCTIISIDDYPLDNSDYYGNGNPNTSNYAFKAIVNTSETIAEGAHMQVQFQNLTVTDPNALFLEKMYVREDNTGSYVFKRGADNRLEKQYVTTGKIIYGYYIEIKTNLTLEDYIAFPYGTDVREGVRVKLQGSEEDGFPEDGGDIDMGKPMPGGDFAVEQDIPEISGEDEYKEDEYKEETGDDFTNSGDMPQENSPEQESNITTMEGGVAL